MTSMCRGYRSSLSIMLMSAWLCSKLVSILLIRQPFYLASPVIRSGLFVDMPSSPFATIPGEENRAIRETHMNQASSRSHSLFQLVIEQRWQDDKGANDRLLRSKFNLIDLAGASVVTWCYHRHTCMPNMRNVLFLMMMSRFGEMESPTRSRQPTRSGAHKHQL